MRALNRAFTILPSASSASDRSRELANAEARGLLAVVDVTAFSGLSLIVCMDVKNEAGQWQEVYRDATEIFGTGDYEFLFYPGASGGNVHEAIPIPLPLECRFRVEHFGSTATYSVRGQWLV